MNNNLPSGWGKSENIPSAWSAENNKKPDPTKKAPPKEETKSSVSESNAKAATASTELSKPEKEVKTPSFDAVRKNDFSDERTQFSPQNKTEKKETKADRLPKSRKSNNHNILKIVCIALIIVLSIATILIFILPQKNEKPVTPQVGTVDSINIETVQSETPKEETGTMTEAETDEKETAEPEITEPSDQSAEETEEPEPLPLEDEDPFVAQTENEEDQKTDLFFRGGLLDDGVDPAYLNFTQKTIDNYDGYWFVEDFGNNYYIEIRLAYKDSGYNIYTLDLYFNGGAFLGSINYKDTFKIKTNRYYSYRVAQEKNYENVVNICLMYLENSLKIMVMGEGIDGIVPSGEFLLTQHDPHNAQFEGGIDASELYYGIPNIFCPLCGDGQFTTGLGYPGHRCYNCDVYFYGKCPVCGEGTGILREHDLLSKHFLFTCSECNAEFKDGAGGSATISKTTRAKGKYKGISTL